MNFSDRKLPSAAAESLRMRPIGEIRPYSLMSVPVYVFMKTNQKFVSVKEPLDFFLPEELEKLRPFESLFFSDFVDIVAPFQESARRTRILLSHRIDDRPNTVGALPPTAFEISDAVLRVLGLLWAGSSSHAGAAFIETYFPVIFANEFCEEFSERQLSRARDQSFSDFELALFRSSWAVFLALHLGYSDLAFLNSFRTDVFERSLGWTATSTSNSSVELDELIQLVFSSICEIDVKNLSSRWFEKREERVARKISARLKRIQDELLDRTRPQATVFGVRGILHE